MKFICLDFVCLRVRQREAEVAASCQIIDDDSDDDVTIIDSTFEPRKRGAPSPVGGRRASVPPLKQKWVMQYCERVRENMIVCMWHVDMDVLLQLICFLNNFIHSYYLAKLYSKRKPSI